MSFADLSAADAERYRAQVEAEGPRKLYELAEFLAADGIPLDQFDASVASLEPLWQWFLGFAYVDFPGIPRDAQPRKEPVELQGPGTARASFASEMVAHYMFEVAKRCFQSVEWVTNPRIGTDRYQRTAVRYVDDDKSAGLAHVDLVSGTIQGALQGLGPRYTEPVRLAKSFLEGTFVCGTTTQERCRQLPRQESILAPMLAGIKPDAPGPFVISTPIARALDHTEPDEMFGGELLFAHANADIENLEDAVPLDLDTVVDTLMTLGFRDLNDAIPTTKTVLAEEFAEFVRDDDAAMITTLVSKRKLRAVQIASANPTATAWAEITDAFTRIAKPNNARLAPEDEF